MKKNLAVLCASVALLAACGGGGGDEAPAPAPTPAPAPAPSSMIPDSVSTSVANYIGYLMALVSLSDDTTEPLDLANVTPPVTDTAEPTALP